MEIGTEYVILGTSPLREKCHDFSNSPNHHGGYIDIRYIRYIRYLDMT